MFDKRLAFTGIAIITVTMIAVLFSKAPSKPEITPIAESVPGIERSAPPSSSDTEPESLGYAYLIKEHEGRIAVFAAGSSEPELVLDVFVKYLPDFDRTQMEKGIEVKDYGALVSLIEDYIS